MPDLLPVFFFPVSNWDRSAGSNNQILVLTYVGLYERFQTRFGREKFPAWEFEKNRLSTNFVNLGGIRGRPTMAHRPACGVGRPTGSSLGSQSQISSFPFSFDTSFLIPCCIIYSSHSFFNIMHHARCPQCSFCSSGVSHWILSSVIIQIKVRTSLLFLQYEDYS